MLFLMFGPVAAYVAFKYIEARYKEYEEFLWFGDGVLGVQYNEMAREMYKEFRVIDERCMRLFTSFCLGCHKRVLEKFCVVDNSHWWVLFNRKKYSDIKQLNNFLLLIY